MNNVSAKDALVSFICLVVLATVVVLGLHALGGGGHSIAPTTSHQTVADPCLNEDPQVASQDPSCNGAPTQDAPDPLGNYP